MFTHYLVSGVGRYLIVKEISRSGEMELEVSFMKFRFSVPGEVYHL